MPYRIKSQLENINFFKVFLYSSTSIWYSPATVLLLHFPVLSHVSSVRWTSSPSHSKKYIDHLLDSSKRISYCTTEYGIFFCSLKVDYPKNGTIVFGPLTNIPYTESDLQQLSSRCYWFYRTSSAEEQHYHYDNSLYPGFHRRWSGLWQRISALRLFYPGFREIEQYRETIWSSVKSRLYFCWKSGGRKNTRLYGRVHSKSNSEWLRTNTGAGGHKPSCACCLFSLVYLYLFFILCNNWSDILSGWSLFPHRSYHQASAWSLSENLQPHKPWSRHSYLLPLFWSPARRYSRRYGSLSSRDLPLW